MSRRHRILFVIPALAQGGAERQLLELARRLDPAEFEPALCVFEDVPHYASLVPDGLTRFTLRVRESGVLRGFRRLVGVMREFQPDLVQSFMDRANLWTRLAASFAGRPRTVTSVRTPRIRWDYLLWQSVLAENDRDLVVVNSRTTRDEIFRRSTVTPASVHLIHNFLDRDAFRPATPAERQAARARFGLTDDHVVLLFSGRTAVQKNQLGLAVALGRLRARGLLPANLRVLVAGRVKDRWYAPIAARAFALARVRDIMVTAGVVSPREVTSLYAAADALLLPSLFEGLPNVALEAHASGVPVVATDAANVDGIVADGETGLVAPLEPGMGPYADAVARLLAMAPAARAEMGRRGRARVLAMFDPDVALARWLSVYRSLLGGRALTPPPR